MILQDVIYMDKIKTIGFDMNYHISYLEDFEYNTISFNPSTPSITLIVI